MNLQTKILQQFQNLYGHQTLKKIAEQTGLSLTRIFRLQNGSRMKLDEYEIFLKLIEEKTHPELIDQLVEEAKLCLSAETLKEVTQGLELKLRLSQIQHEEESCSAF